MSLHTLVKPPDRMMVEALLRFSGNGGICVDAPVAAFKFGQTTLVVFEVLQANQLEPAIAAVLDSGIEVLSDASAFSVLLVPVTSGRSNLKRTVLGRGIAALGFHEAIADVIGLASGWRDSQSELIARSLSDLLVADELRNATLYAIHEGQRVPVRSFLENNLLLWTAPSGRPIYLKAEAGKGKSTAFAELAWVHQGKTSQPLPLLVPLRSVQRGVGVSWAGIAASVGVVGQQATNLAKAVQCGVVCLLLDGLDEVAGRYDPNLVNELLAEVKEALVGAQSRVAISGRTTESLLMGASFGHGHHEAALELPDSLEPAFSDYVGRVVDSITPDWPLMATRVPEPPLDHPTLPNEPPSAQQKLQIVNWTSRIFDELGKERSLFFVQSLACIGRTYQLAGNRPLLIESQSGPQVAKAGIYDVCVLAAALACIREQDKIEDLATKVFAPSKQLELLTWLALKASAEDSSRDDLPGTKALAQAVFGIDPVNQNEEFTAVVRQMQKHALLFASIEPSANAGDWRPHFLSDWVRCALLCRAWLNCVRMADFLSAGTTARTVARSQRSTLAFSVIFPELYITDRLVNLQELIGALCDAADGDSPEAAANFWNLYAGLMDRLAEVPHRNPKQIPPMTDLTGFALAGGELPAEFAGTLIVCVEAEFEGVTLRGSRFDQCDFSGAVFRNCELVDVVFDSCDGPILFEGCLFRNCTLKNMSGRAPTLLRFDECELLEGTMILQAEPPVKFGWEYSPIALFSDCRSDRSADQAMSGDCIGIDPGRIQGLDVISEKSVDGAEICTRAMLKPFFPVRAGTTGQRQARGYIRTSALGRGTMPAGAPTDGNLFLILESVGFSTGGRQGHLYAPWSGVGGASADGVQLRNELLAFLTSGKRSQRVSNLIEKVRQEGVWTD